MAPVPPLQRAFDHARGARASLPLRAPPATVVAAELDRATGLLADENTPAGRRYVEYFVRGTEPTPLRVDARRLFRLGPIAFF